MQPINIDFSGAFAESIGAKNGITPEELTEALKRLSNTKIDFPFLKLIDNQSNIITNIHHTAEDVMCRFQNFVVLGIGGSALGLKTLSQALLPPYFNLLDSTQRKGFPRLFVCDNIDPDHFSALIHLLDWKETGVNVISKSGKTTETAAQLYIIKDILSKKLGPKKWKEHVYITTDPNSGPLRRMIIKDGFKNFVIPPDVGGRYSVFSPVGLFPAACVGINIVALLSGAREMAKRCAFPNLDNPALKNAAIHYLMDTKKSKPISVMLPYSDSLALFADWYAQLWAESLGKKGKGPTPVKALGATDQHSQIQLYMDGPSDKIITFVGIEKFASKLKIPATSKDSDFAYLAGKDLGAVLQAEQKATETALRQNGKPTIRITLPDLSAESIGQLLMMYQIQTPLAGMLYGIDPFDQPGVELGKKLTRQILETQNLSGSR